MKKNALISIIVPAYNTEKYIEKCIESVLSQTYKNFELIIIDDGSRDRTIDIVKMYIKKDYKRIKLISKVNGGAATARNFGLKECKGEYIFFLDSDDWIDCNTLELLLNEAKEKEADIVIPKSYYNVYENEYKKKRDLFTLKINFKDIEEYVIKVLIGSAQGWRVSSNLYRADIILKNEIYFPEGHTAEDFVFNLRFFLYAKTISFIDYPTLYVVKRKGSVTTSYQENLAATFNLIDDEVKKYLKEMGIDNNANNAINNSLFIRNTIILLGNILKKQNIIMHKDVVEYIKIIFENDRVQEVFFIQKDFVMYIKGIKKIYFSLIKYLLSHKQYYIVAIILRLRKKIRLNIKAKKR